MVVLKNLGQVCQDFKDRVDFAFVYIREQHPEDDKEDVAKLQKLFTHRSFEDRLEAAEKLKKWCPDVLKENSSVLVDYMSGEANRAYAGSPDRLYVVQNNTVVYDGGVGPWYFNVDHLESWLKMNC